jgi:hypothetical protein
MRFPICARRRWRSTCYFDPDGSGKPRYRLVYRFSPDEVTAVAIEAIAVGQRSGLQVYLTAAGRLGRLTEE